MNTIKNQSDYFAALCKKHKIVAHEIDGRNSFHKMNNLEDLYSANVVDGCFPCVIHMDTSGRFTGTENANAKNISSHQLLFLAKTDEHTDTDARLLAYDQAQRIMFDFVSKIYMDSLNQCGPFEFMDLSKFTYVVADDIGHCCFGWLLSFSEDQPAEEVEYSNNENWL